MYMYRFLIYQLRSPSLQNVYFCLTWCTYQSNSIRKLVQENYLFYYVSLSAFRNIFFFCSYVIYFFSALKIVKYYQHRNNVCLLSNLTYTQTNWPTVLIYFVLHRYLYNNIHIQMFELINHYLSQFLQQYNVLQWQLNDR